MDPAFLSVIASIVLAILTAIYVIQTQGMLREMTKARKAEFQPHVKATLKPLGPLFVELALENVGKGAAIDVEVTFSVKPGEFEKNWRHPILSPGDSERFFLPEGNLKKLAKKYDKVIVTGICKDVFGEKHTIDEQIDIKEIQKGWHESGFVLKKTVETRLGEIHKELERLERSLDRLTRRGILTKTVEDVRKEEEEFKKFVEEKRKEMQKKEASKSKPKK